MRVRSTDIEMFSLLEPIADGFRNHRARLDASTTESFKLIDKAQQHRRPRQMTVLAGGMRVPGTNPLTAARTVSLSTDRACSAQTLRQSGWICVTSGSPPTTLNELFSCRDRLTGEVKYTATRADLRLSNLYCARWRKFTREAMRTRSL